MATLRRLERAQSQLINISWANMGLLLLLHGAVSWIWLYFTGDRALCDPAIFFYFWITTGTTVGYGDYAPVSLGGRLATAVWIMPGAILWISAALAKLASALYLTWSYRMQRDDAGLGNYDDLNGHVVVFGYVPDKTAKLITMLQNEKSERRKILLISTNVSNPLDGSAVRFVRATSLTDEDAIQRAALERASVIIALGPNDAETLSASLAAAAVNPSAHLVSYFEQNSSARVLRLHCPQAEIISSVFVQAIARAAQDPGSSELFDELLHPNRGQTQYSLHVPAGSQSTFGQLFVRLKQHHEALLLGVRAAGATTDALELNPSWDRPLHSGDVLYYMASQRIDLSNPHLFIGSPKA
ncbi:MAG: two pore domain potassium channel family protein [Gammaproteobacteria bacterium]|nr:two pore domain potassium channel family protein [Gammaproteobacteria bacterium]